MLRWCEYFFSMLISCLISSSSSWEDRMAEPKATPLPTSVSLPVPRPRRSLPP